MLIGKFFIIIMEVVITIPHSEAPKDAPVNSHYWDFTAEDFANRVKTVFEQKNTVTLIPANNPRTLLDYNRPWSRNDEWRMIVKNKIKGKDNVLHIDAHSYPATYSGFDGFDIAILSRRRPITCDCNLAAIIAAKSGIKCGLVISPGMVDIRAEMEELLHDPSRTIMIEVSEGATAKYDTLAKLIAENIEVGINSNICKVMDPNIPCFYVDPKSPSQRIPLWIPSSNVNKPRLFQCANCKKTGGENYIICEGCGSVSYCSKSCQQKDWNVNRHHMLCSILAMPPKNLYVGAKLREYKRCPCGHPQNVCSLCGIHFCSDTSNEWLLHKQTCYIENIGL